MISLYADEDIPLPLVRALRLQGIKVITTQEMKMMGKTDVEQLLFATSLNAVLFTHNVKDFARIHNEFQNKKIQHGGVIVSKKDALGILLRKMLHLNATLSMRDAGNRLEYLHNW